MAVPAHCLTWRRRTHRKPQLGADHDGQRPELASRCVRSARPTPTARPHDGRCPSARTRPPAAVADCPSGPPPHPSPPRMDAARRLSSPPPPLLGRSLVTSARRLPLRRRRHFLLQRHPCLPTTVSRDRRALSRDLEVGESSPPTGHYRQLGRRRGGQLRCGRRQVGITRERGTGERERDTWATVATDRGERGSHEVLRGPPIGAGGGRAGTPIRGSKRNSRALTLAGRFGEGAGTRHQPPLLGVRERGRSPGERVEGDRPTRVKETDHAYCT